MNQIAWYSDRLACPDCGNVLADSAKSTFECACGYTTARNSEPLDLRPMTPSPRSLHAQLLSAAPQSLASCLVERPAPAYWGPVPGRDSSELFSAVTDGIAPGQSLLDLGCGPRDQAVAAAHLGLRYLGLDYSSPAADVLADAHALPFQEGSFDLVLSYAVFEHLYNPFLAAHEVARVLKAGGVFFGTVSQGEPFHDSYFHHTAWGILHLCESAGLRVERVWGSYDTLRALAVMGRYPKLGRVLIGILDRLFSAVPILSPRKFFAWSPRQRKVDALHRAASICFVARKPR